MTNRQTDKQTDRQTGRQTDRQTDKHTDLHTEMKAYQVILVAPSDTDTDYFLQFVKELSVTIRKSEISSSIEPRAVFTLRSCSV